MSRNKYTNANINSPAATDDIERLEADIEIKAEHAPVSMVPEGGWGWMVVLGAFMIHVIGPGIQASYGVFLEDFVDYFESSKSAVGGIGSLMIGTASASGNAGLLVAMITETIYLFAVICKAALVILRLDI